MEDQNREGQNKEDHKTEMECRGRLLAICISERRGTQKHPVHAARLIENFGIEQDAHAGDWHRQVSLLSAEKVAAFNARGAAVEDGAFGENLLVEGIDPAALPMGTILTIGTCRLRLTQRGKACHNHCEIYKRMGECIMPTQGVFAEVITGGEIADGMEISAALPDRDSAPTAAVLVASDKGAKGERRDESGPRAAELLTAAGYRVVEVLVVPDEEQNIASELKRLCDQREVQLVVTSGGTGLSPRDVTPEATRSVATRDVPGISEAIRAASMQHTNRAMLSRGISVLRGSSLIVNLPGSPKAVAESLEVILEPVRHGLHILRGTDGECAR